MLQKEPLLKVPTQERGWSLQFFALALILFLGVASIIFEHDTSSEIQVGAGKVVDGYMTYQIGEKPPTFYPDGYFPPPDYDIANKQTPINHGGGSSPQDFQIPYKGSRIGWGKVPAVGEVGAKVVTVGLSSCSIVVCTMPGGTLQIFHDYFSSDKAGNVQGFTNWPAGAKTWESVKKNQVFGDTQGDPGSKNGFIYSPNHAGADKLWPNTGAAGLNDCEMNPDLSFLYQVDYDFVPLGGLYDPEHPDTPLAKDQGGVVVMTRTFWRLVGTGTGWKRETFQYRQLGAPG